MSDKKLDEFTKYILKDVNQEQPSIDFVANVMKSVKADPSLVFSKVYKPLISKKGWLFIAVIITGLFILTILSNTNNTELIPTFNLSFLNKIKIINPFENIKFSNVFTFSFVFFAAMVLLQVAVIKSYFNKHNSI